MEDFKQYCGIIRKLPLKQEKTGSFNTSGFLFELAEWEGFEPYKQG